MFTSTSHCGQWKEKRRRHTSPVRNRTVLLIFASYRPQIVEFLRKQEDFVDLMIKHIGTSAIMDLLLRMLTCIEPPQLRQDVLCVSRWDKSDKTILG